MRLFKIIFKLLLIVMVLFAFLNDFGFLNLDDGFKFALPKKGELPNIEPMTVTSATYQKLPFSDITVYTIKTTAGNHILYGLSDVQVAGLATAVAGSLVPITAYSGANALLYIAVLFGIMMIPTKKILRIKKIKNSRR